MDKYYLTQTVLCNELSNDNTIQIVHGNHEIKMKDLNKLIAIRHVKDNTILSERFVTTCIKQ